MDLNGLSPQDILNENVETAHIDILIVDDDSTNRFVLQTMLQKAGHNVYAAADGFEAVELYKSERPDLVLMDVMMPGMDGFEATKKIKEEIVDDYVPVIFLTALSDEQALAKCIDSGGDDFLSKPYKKDLLNAKLQAHIRLKHLYGTAKRQRNELYEHNERVHSEQVLAQQIYKGMVHAGCLDNSNIQFMMSSMALFNGDVLFGAITPSGCLHIMLGDFTGHGLSAAIGAVPLSNVFYTMTSKGFGISDIVSEMNKKLKDLLPVGMFCAACVYELDPVGNTLRIWNGGIPCAYICNSENTEIKYNVKSSHIPLGILSSEKFDATEDVINLATGDYIYLCTDGITEARNPEGEMFGEERVKKILSAGQKQGPGFASLRQSLKDYCQNNEQEDDMTFIEVRVDPVEIKVPAKLNATDTGISEGKNQEHPSLECDWDMSITMDISVLKKVDPIPLLNQLVVDLSCKDENKQEIFLVLSELISNAIDHGILQLDSKVKLGEDGFVKYYSDRKHKFDEIKNGWVHIDMKHISLEKEQKLIVHIKDSGNGFDFTEKGEELTINRNPSGRGIPLVEQLCESIEHLGCGNEVVAIYRWD